MSLVESSATSGRASPLRAAVDKALAYGADSEFGFSPGRDPWGMDCLKTMINVLVNHDECYYLLPTMRAAQGDRADMPQTLIAARAAALVQPAASDVAERVELTQEFALKQFAIFEQLVSKKYPELRQFDNYHLGLRPEHNVVIPTTVLDRTQEFWTANSDRVTALQQSTPLPEDELRYLFDVAIRVSAYQTIAAKEDAIYFAHPIRDNFGAPGDASAEECEGSWWGDIVVGLIRDGHIRNDPRPLMDKVAEIRQAVLDNDARVSDLRFYREKDRADRLRAAACDAGLPAYLSDGCLKKTANVGTATGATLLAAGQLLSGFVLMTISGILGETEIRVPGSVVSKCKVVRGMFRWTK